MSITNGQLIIGREYPKADENETMAVMVQEMKDQLDRLYANKTTLRQVHSKMHACVKAEFVIEPNLPEEYKVGIFKEPKVFPAWIRFSNGDTKVRHDKKKDTRGAAIKLMNVPGEKLLDYQKDAQTQDFVLGASKIFFAKDLETFHGLMSASISTNKWALPLFFLRHPRTMVRALTKVLINCAHPMAISYNSITPFRFGDETRAVKYGFHPSAGNTLEHPDKTSFNFLKKNVVATLAERDISFDFCVQFQTDANKMPVEDSTIEWTSPFIKLATIKIPRQTFDSPAQIEFGENLTYNIWHSLPEHRPIGSFNRARKAIYEQMYKYRLDKNQVIAAEPTAPPDFFTNLFLNNGKQ